MRRSEQQVLHEAQLPTPLRTQSVTAPAQTTRPAAQRAAPTWAISLHGTTHERDSLTALPSAPLFRRRIASALLTAIERRQPMAILAVHLGDPRDWQGVSGASAIRTVLATYAIRLGRSLHSRGMLNRSALCDFTVALENIPGETEFAAQLHGLHKTLMEPIVIAGRDVAIRPYIGVAICPFDGLTAEALTKRSAAAARVALQDAREVEFFGASSE